MIKYHTIRVIEVFDWDKLIEETYGRPYSLQQQDGCKDRGAEYFSVPEEDFEDFENTSIPEVVNGKERGVSFEAWLERSPDQPIENERDEWERTLFWQRNFYPHLQAVVNDLYKRGLIEAGDYQIDIDW